MLAVSVAKGAEASCDLRLLTFDQRLAVDKTPNAIGKVGEYEIHANVYDPEKMPVGGEAFLRFTSISTGVSCKPPQPDGMLVKLFYDASKQYLFAETSEHAGQSIMAIRLNDCTGMWNVAYAHIHPPNRIERLPFCTGDGYEAYCFPAVFIDLKGGCTPVEDQRRAKEVTEKAFGQTLTKEPTIVSSDDSPILRTYRRYLKSRPKTATAY